MVKVIPLLSKVIFKSDEDDRSDQALWHRDPLSHPDLKRMSERELADLTFAPERVLPD